jgi:radical SAM protein with 4Fe4S-binding SPASM domain
VSETIPEHLGPGGYRAELPFHMVWLATNACTARCLHCSSASARRGPDELTTPEALDLMNQLAAAGVVDLAISGGEPLLRRDVIRVIYRARELGMSVGIGSNGAKLAPARAQELVEAGLGRFQISLDGLAAEHDELRRWPGLFWRAVNSIGTAQAAGLRVHICCTITRLNVHQLESLAEFIAGLSVRRLNLSRFVPTGRGTAALDLDDSAWHEVAHRIVAIKNRYEGRMEVTTHLAQQILVDPCLLDMPGFVGCQAGMGQGCVTSNGTVLPCVLLPIPIGSIRTKPFVDLWSRSPVIRKLQGRQDLGAPCSTCAFLDRCGGCRAVAFARTGNYLSADPRCWLNSRVSN